MYFPTRFTAILAAGLLGACDGAVLATAPEGGVHAVGFL